ncbi:hypothetical protein ACW9HR_36385, partial [Nocardia gipuzkoensis]
MSMHDPGQFARLIANLHAAVTFTDDLVMALAAAMNLRPEDLTELIDHAETLRYHGFARTNGVTSAKVYRGSGSTDNTAPQNSAPPYQHSPTPAVPLPRSALPHSPLGPPEPVLISINHAALAGCLRNAAWLRTVPTTARGWNLRWHKNTRLIIDGLVAHGGVFSANLPSGMPVTLRYDDLTDPVGVQVWAQTGTDDDPWGVRLATVEYEHGLHYAADPTPRPKPSRPSSPTSSTASTTTYAQCAWSSQQTPHHRPPPIRSSASNWWCSAIPTPAPTSTCTSLRAELHLTQASWGSLWCYVGEPGDT